MWVCVSSLVLRIWSSSPNSHAIASLRPTTRAQDDLEPARQELDKQPTLLQIGRWAQTQL